jgi:putative inorganic carbon (hco3(-)) transporter
MEALYRLELRAIWSTFWREHFSFWMICGYLFVEYVRPQSIMPELDVLPWGKVFLILSLGGLLADPHRKWVSDRTNLVITLFLFVLFLSAVFAEYPEVSRRQWFDFVGWYVIYFLIISIVNNERRFFILLLIFLLASFKLSFHGARTWTMRGFAFTDWGLAGPPGHFQNSGELSVQMLMFAPLAFQLALFAKPRVSKLKFWLLMSAPLTAVMTVIGAASRGSQLAMVYQFYRIQLKGKLTLKRVAVAAAIFAIGFALMPEEQKARFTSAGEDRTSQQRLLYWKRGVEMIGDHPVLGVGYFNFTTYFSTHYPQDMLYEAAQLPHNIFVQVGTDAGLLGLGVFIALLYRNIRCAREIQRRAQANPQLLGFHGNIAKGLQIATWGFIVAGQFVTITYYPFFWMNLALTVALLNITRRAEEEHGRASKA